MVRYGIVVSMPDVDKKTQSGMCRVFIPGFHSNEYKEEDLTLCSLGAGGDQEGVTRFSGPPEPGSWVQIRLDPGFNKTNGNGVIERVIKDPKNVKQSLPGNFSIRDFDLVQKAFTRKLPINSKAKAGNGPSGTKPTEEAGEKYYRDLTKAIPASATLWQIAGMKIPQVKNIPTAKTPYSNILPADALGSLPGAAMSLGNLFKNMPSSKKAELDSKLPKETSESLNTIINLIPEDEPSGLTGDRVNTEIFYTYAVTLLSECRDIEDIMLVIQELLSNTQLHGAETLGNTVIQITTPFGNSNVIFTSSGNSTQKNDDKTQKASDSFTSLLSSASQFPSVFPDKNMWGESSQIMGEMMTRLKPEEQTKAVQQAQKSIAPGTKPRQLINTIHGLVMLGKNFM
jgi:hypothetical protein